MNIQEGIKELESLKMKSEDIRSDCYNNGINAGIAVMKKLDEPQKPVVPKFVAEYLNYCMANELTLREAFLAGKFQLPEYLHKAVDWLNDSMNQNIFAQAWLFGYEIKKEPLYRVKLGEGYFVEYQGRGAMIMIIPDDNKEIKIFDSKSDAERTAQTIGGTVEEVAEG
ncbi:DUF1642 domain-containing protein [Enterococcus faecium]|nr:DUF1642 domain-containing protein [Enterococcus faecium]EME3503466.1 DUF1642 domain-containing protein [Enterococcus faecium]EME3544707.1 DUF1642 domain-containing protein [Enterococcus faecium]EME7138599.1 DUF1642 domain-containing protein [Enterococcus faecium]